DEVRAEFERKTKKLARERKKWEKGMDEWRGRNSQLAAEWDRYWSHTLPDGFEMQLVEAAKSDKPIATRELSGQVIQKLAAIAPFFIGGAADLSTSTKTNIKETTNIVRAKETPDKPPSLETFKGRNLYFAVRENSMGAEVNGW